MPLRHAVIAGLLLVLSWSQALSGVCDVNCQMAQKIGTWGLPGRHTGYECIRPTPCPGSGSGGTEWGYIIAYKDSSGVKCGIAKSSTDWGPEPTNYGIVSGNVIEHCFAAFWELNGYISIHCCPVKLTGLAE
jgi:hypothetical protein